METEWKKHPVLHLDLNAEKYDSSERLYDILSRQLSQWELQYGKGIDENTLSGRFSGIIRRASEQTGCSVVVLVDEYDKPLLQALGNDELLEDYRKTLKAFYGVLKSAFVNKIRRNMTKDTDIQADGNLTDNFRGYAALLRKIKQRVLIAQQRVIYAANEEMLRMYWDVGEMLQQSQDADGWGKKTLQRLAVDLKNDYSEIKGFTVRNMQYMVQSITNHWTTRYLQEAIKLDDYGKHGALANNFTEPLPVPEANDVKSMLKDPYIFDMLTFTEQYNERDVEIGLVKHVEKFLVEMGAGFAFMGRQYHIEVSGDDYYIDILMYNAFLHCYLVIELKDTEFMPEYIGKLNFYCSAVDDILCREGDNRTIGLLLCKSKDRIKAEYALRDIQKPIGISDYELGQALPKDFRGSLPTIEEIEKELESNRE